MGDAYLYVMLACFVVSLGRVISRRSYARGYAAGLERKARNLDSIAMTAGIKRRPGESDEDLHARMRNVYDPTVAPTRRRVLAVLNEMRPAHVTLEEFIDAIDPRKNP